MLVAEAGQADLVCTIYRTTSIGDVVLATAALDLLAQIPQRVFVFWIGRNPALSLIKQAYPQIHGIALEKSASVEIIETLRTLIPRLDFVVDLQKNLRSQIVCSGLSKAYKAPVFSWKKRGMQRSLLIFNSHIFSRSRAAPIHIQRSEHPQFKAMLEATQNALKKSQYRDAIPSDLAAAVPKLPTAHGEMQSSWQKELKFGMWLAVAPGASFPSKKAPSELFVRTLTTWRAQATGSDVGLVMLGDEKDRQQCLEILDQLRWQGPVLNLAGKLSLWECALALTSVRLLLSNDSSLAHIAEATGTPVGVFFGPTVEAFGFAPRLASSASFSSLLGCRPCSKHGKSSCRYGDLLCFKSINIESVVQFLSRHLAVERVNEHDC